MLASLTNLDMKLATRELHLRNSLLRNEHIDFVLCYLTIQNHCVLCGASIDKDINRVYAQVEVLFRCIIHDVQLF